MSSSRLNGATEICIAGLCVALFSSAGIAASLKTSSNIVESWLHLPPDMGEARRATMVFGVGARKAF